MGIDSYKNKTTQSTMTNKMNDLNQILNNSWDGICLIDEKANIIFTNKALTPILNFTKEQLLKLNFLNLIDDNYRDVMKFAIVKAKRLKEVTHIKIVCKRQDKQHVHLDCSLVLMQNQKYFVMNLKDCTQQVAKDALINDYILSYELDPKGYILSISNALCHLLHYDKETLINKPYSKIADKDSNTLTLPILLEEVNKNLEWKGTIQLRNRDSELFLFDTTVKPTYNKYGDITHYVFLCFNQQTHPKSYQEIELSNQKQPRVSFSSETKLSTLTPIIDTVTAVWLDSLTRLQEELNRVESKRNTNDNDINKELDSINELTTLLLTNMKQFNTALSVSSEKKETDIKELIVTILNRLEQSNSKDNNIIIEKNLNDVPLTLTHTQELNEILFSLFTNSLEAFAYYKTSHPMIDVSLMTNQKEELVLQIIDNATHLTSEVLNRLFDPYFTTKQDPMKGMGLYKAKLIIEHHLNGSISIENEDNMTIVSIVLPIIEP